MESSFEEELFHFGVGFVLPAELEIVINDSEYIQHFQRYWPNDSTHYSGRALVDCSANLRIPFTRYVSPEQASGSWTVGHCCCRLGQRTNIVKQLVTASYPGVTTVAQIAVSDTINERLDMCSWGDKNGAF